MRSYGCVVIYATNVRCSLPLRQESRGSSSRPRQSPRGHYRFGFSCCEVSLLLVETNPRSVIDLRIKERCSGKIAAIARAWVTRAEFYANVSGVGGTAA